MHCWARRLRADRVDGRRRCHHRQHLLHWKSELKLHSSWGSAEIKRTQDRPVTVAVAGCVAQQEGEKLSSATVNSIWSLDGRCARVRAGLRSRFHGAPRHQAGARHRFLRLDTYVFASDLDPASEGHRRVRHHPEGATTSARSASCPRRGAEVCVLRTNCGRGSSACRIWRSWDHPDRPKP